jgi:hypothetical protein
MNSSQQDWVARIAAERTAIRERQDRRWQQQCLRHAAADRCIAGAWIRSARLDAFQRRLFRRNAVIAIDVHVGAATVFLASLGLWLAFAFLFLP